MNTDTTTDGRVRARRYGFHVVHEAALRSHPWLREHLPAVGELDFAATLLDAPDDVPRCRGAARLPDGAAVLGALYVELSAQSHGMASTSPDAAPPPWIAALWPEVLRRMAELGAVDRARATEAATSTAALLTRWLRDA